MRCVLSMLATDGHGWNKCNVTSSCILQYPTYLHSILCRSVTFLAAVELSTYLLNVKYKGETGDIVIPSLLMCTPPLLPSMSMFWTYHFQSTVLAVKMLCGHIQLLQAHRLTVWWNITICTSSLVLSPPYFMSLASLPSLLFSLFFPPPFSSWTWSCSVWATVLGSDTSPCVLMCRTSCQKHNKVGKTVIMNRNKLWNMLSHMYIKDCTHLSPL